MELITYKKFNDAALANQLAEVLQRHQINYNIVEEATLFNPTFYTDETAKDYAVKISADEFLKVDELLKAEESKSVDATDNDHYLYSFTNDELTDLIAKPDEWSQFDNLLAVKILKERGIYITDQAIAQLTLKRLNELKQPEKPQNTWIVLGYLFAISGGILGAFIGWHLYIHKKTLPNGEQVYGYNESDRAHGRIIFYFSIMILILLIIVKILLIN
ncbi:hypothetical protein [Mucilaginibacter phyllosphaerae]|uniref:DUF2007 domain-containing protein n=1 Tax=Mucilaginibacter phyllosphaerae TaxID=1812349 RepID=A0A4Y8A7L1_9SPHI|nr:hypothetical protein [Mucilaginibacter phyllosphaerae]MBB3971060.1 hypothetical protein [Mucilaginibacter phyllosphaerae]TEW63798.1 hypothetical protein E2R65_18710 [Mucilaginibacter phyllosphaerae]GGH22240.1 hypothetical protein GCM10007352_35420 [Mucilaginibacter phyllosphaerae]